MDDYICQLSESVGSLKVLLKGRTITAKTKGYISTFHDRYNDYLKAIESSSDYDHIEKMASHVQIYATAISQNILKSSGENDTEIKDFSDKLSDLSSKLKNTIEEREVTYDDESRSAITERIKPRKVKPIMENKVSPTTQTQKSKVFIVHGRDNEAKQEVGRFIETIGLETIILHEQASSGMTIIEKIEYYASEADFALILYTPCDYGRGIHEENENNKQRARQNVVFEHGYLMSKLGRRNVCALVKGNIETPNDISGVVYVALDIAGAWKAEVIKELKACGYQTKQWP